MTTDKPDSFGHLPPSGFALVDEVVSVALAMAPAKRGIPAVLLEASGSTRNRLVVYGPGAPLADEARRAARGRMQTGRGSAVAFDLSATGEAGRVEAVAVEIWLDGMAAPVRYLQRYRRVDDAPVRTDHAMVAGACAWPGDEAPRPAGGKSCTSSR